MGAVSAVTDFVGDAVDTVVDTVSDVGSFVDDAVNDVVPGGWYTVAAVAAPYAIPELGAALGATEAGATGLSTLPDSVLTAGEAFGTGGGSLATDAALSAGAGASGTAAADAAISGLGEVPWESLGDQAGDFPLSGSYGSPTAPGVQEAAQNLLDTNALQSLSGAPLDVLGDQPGDFPLEGGYGDPLAPGVQEATQNLLDYNAANALSGYTPSSSTISNALKSVLGGGSALGGLTSLGSSGSSGDTSGIKNLTPGLTHANTNFELAGEPAVHAAGGGSMNSYFNSGISSSDSDAYNYLDAANAKLKAGLLKPNINFVLSGLPQGRAEGGAIEGHNPEFYSEGGLENRYVKGDGDGTSDSVPAMLASGEFVIPADVVSGLGNGDNDAGAQILDEFLAVIRSHKRAADPKDLPEDSKGPLAYLAEAKKKVRE